MPVPGTDEEVEVMFTDELKSYPPAMRSAGIAEHEAVNHSAGEYVSGNVHTNTIESAFSLFKRGLMGSWHKISVKLRLPRKLAVLRAHSKTGYYAHGE